MRSSKVIFTLFRKKVFKKLFQVISKKKIKKSPKNKLFYKKRSTKFYGFQKYCCLEAENKTIFEDLKLSRPRTSKCVLEDSTSANGM